jgi:hypothetical protein
VLSDTHKSFKGKQVALVLADLKIDKKMPCIHRTEINSILRFQSKEKAQNEFKEELFVFISLVHDFI